MVHKAMYVRLSATFSEAGPPSWPYQRWKPPTKHRYSPVFIQSPKIPSPRASLYEGQRTPWPPPAGEAPPPERRQKVHRSCGFPLRGTVSRAAAGGRGGGGKPPPYEGMISVGREYFHCGMIATGDHGYLYRCAMPHPAGRIRPPGPAAVWGKRKAPLPAEGALGTVSDQYIPPA